MIRHVDEDGKELDRYELAVKGPNQTRSMPFHALKIESNFYYSVAPVHLRIDARSLKVSTKYSRFVSTSIVLKLFHIEPVSVQRVFTTGKWKNIVEGIVS